jgi:hypothetical protein
MNLKKIFTYLAITLGLVLITTSLAYAFIPTQISTINAAKSKQDSFKASYAWVPTPVADDPLVRMPGSQPGQVSLEGPNRCLNCHSGYDQPVEPGFNWQGSMMAQAGRDFLFWSCLTVAGQDSIWAVGSPNAVDICERCHFPKGWLEGRSDPPNVSAITGDDYDGIFCDFCHRMYDPFFQTTYTGDREGSDWLNYWDETNNSNTPSSTYSDATYIEDQLIAQGILLFNGNNFYGVDNLPFSSAYNENGGGHYFVSPNDEKRASFADAEPVSHNIYYSRYHKSKYFCGTCHDVSNPVLANLGQDGTQPLNTETYAAYSYYHVERTFSEFMLSAYGQQDGAPGSGSFAPEVFNTSLANNNIARCQDCHMRDVEGAGCDKQGALVRPTESVEHPMSGLPMHDMTGGNAWVSYVLASTVKGSANYDSINDGLLNQGPDLLTLDLTQGQGVDSEALLASVERTKQQLNNAASIEGLDYDYDLGSLSFRIQNHTGHKLISGFPEGRRMFINIKVYAADDSLIYEVNPYDYQAGTLKGLDYDYVLDPSGIPPLPDEINPLNEVHLKELIYEIHPSSDLTGEEKTFHFALATGRSKDNRIPPQGFLIDQAEERIVEPVWEGTPDPKYFSAEEYAGGYDAVSLIVPSGADRLVVNLYYQTTSREYVEFLRDEINGVAETLPVEAYIIQDDPFFDKLKAWGSTIWQLWTNNMDVAGAEPFLMTQAVYQDHRPTKTPTPTSTPTNTPTLTPTHTPTPTSTSTPTPTNTPTPTSTPEEPVEEVYLPFIIDESSSPAENNPNTITRFWLVFLDWLNGLQ